MMTRQEQVIALRLVGTELLVECGHCRPPFYREGCKQRVSLDCVLLAPIPRGGKGSMFFALPVVGKISATTREQRARWHQGTTRHGTLPGGGLVQGEGYGITGQTVTAALGEALCTIGASALSA